MQQSIFVVVDNSLDERASSFRVARCNELSNLMSNELSI
jgi:hypothetical protein